MLDHLVGKPSANWKRTQVLLMMSVGWWVLVKGDTNRLPKVFQKINKSLVGTSPWKITVSAWLAYYVFQNLFHLIGLNAPEPLARLYKRSYFRATWILTALDAGFFTAMSLKPNWLRHLCSVLFSLYYLVFADDAEEKVRRVRATMSVEQMRLSWEKGAANPILSGLSSILRPKFTIRQIFQVERPDYHHHLPPTEVYFFYAGHPDTLAQHNTIILQFPGGGFVSMPPPCHEDSIAAWAKQTGLPILSVNYKKAPEYPYPWPIDECFDLYVTLVRDRGKSFGLSGEKDLNIIVIGDSAGGNVTSAVTLKIIAHNEYIEHKERTPDEPLPHYLTIHQQEPLFNEILPVPIGLILIYPALDFELSCWMSPNQLQLIRAESKTQLFRSGSLETLWQTKDHFSHVSPLSVVPDTEKPSLWRRAYNSTLSNNKRPKLQYSRDPSIRERVQQLDYDKSAWASSRLAMTSRMSFFNDRIITPDMMRAMAILYLGPHANPDFEADYLLSPIVAPLELLAKFPRAYMMCGEKDPFVDDTVIFASRIRQAKMKYNLNPSHRDVHVKFLEGISHAFLQMMAFLPEAPQAAKTIGVWIQDLASDHTHLQTSTSFVRSLSSGIPSNKVDVSSHVAEIITSEKDMIHRRKQQLVDALY
ncbi:unnamed protein product [Cunninghamella echinulata]